MPICSGHRRATGLSGAGGHRDGVRAAAKSAERAGRQLAALHRVSQARFGWYRDNTIGSTPQSNTETASWIDFWRDQRLGFQLELAARNGYGGALQRLGDRLDGKVSRSARA